MSKPEIQFEGYTDDWKQRKLGEMMEVGSVKRVHQSDWRDSGVRFLRARDIVADYKHEDPDDYLYIDEQLYNEYSAQSGKVQMGDLLVTGVGTIGIPMLVKTAKPIYFKDGNIIWFKNKNDIDGYFFYYAFTSKKIQDFIKESAGTGTVGTYTIDSGKKTPIILPVNKAEQERIGAYFHNIDYLITLHQNKYESLIKLKKSMLVKMFPKEGEKRPEIRFEGFDDDWKQGKLRELADVKDSARIPNALWTKEGVPYIRSSDISNNDLTGVLFLNPKIFSIYRDKTGAPEQGDVLFNGGGEIGKALLKLDQNPIYVQGGAVLYAKTSRSKMLNGKYLLAYFLSPQAKKYIDLSQAGGTMKHFTLGPAQEMPITYPNWNEQERIGQYFLQLDRFITLYRRKCEVLKHLKSALLNKMFI